MAGAHRARPSHAGGPRHDCGRRGHSGRGGRCPRRPPRHAPPLVVPSSRSASTHPRGASPVTDDLDRELRARLEQLMSAVPVERPAAGALPALALGRTTVASRARLGLGGLTVAVIAVVLAALTFGRPTVF